MNKIYLLIGSNIGNRSENLLNAANSIAEKIGRIIGKSHIYETEPWGYKSEALFYNQCMLVESNMNALNVLKELKAIEKEMGRREKGEKIIDRIIDIDILFFNDESINLKNLIIPHPKMHERKFALVPLSELASGFIHPVFNRSVEQLLFECEDSLMVRKTSC